jgi:hypothetical protein
MKETISTNPMDVTQPIELVATKRIDDYIDKDAPIPLVSTQFVDVIKSIIDMFKEEILKYITPKIKTDPIIKSNNVVDENVVMYATTTIDPIYLLLIT